MHNAPAPYPDILNSIYGALFFGVPNQGMDIESLIPMVKNQVNRGLLYDLGNESQLLRTQSRDFPKAFDSPRTKIVCFYETVKSPTAIKAGLLSQSRMTVFWLTILCHRRVVNGP
jgi:hypothetical protein